MRDLAMFIHFDLFYPNKSHFPTNPKTKIYPTMRPINPKESNLVNDIEVLLDCKVRVNF